MAAPTVGNSAVSITNMKIADAGIGINPISSWGSTETGTVHVFETSGNVGRHRGNEYDLIVSWKHRTMFP